MIKNIIFDIGGVMFDDSTQNISNILNIDASELCKKVYGKSFIDCLLGNQEVSNYIESFKMPTNYTNDDINKCFKGLRGMILCSTEVLKVKNEQNLKIVNIMSSAARRGNKQEAVYCATKWGEKGYTESLKVAYKGTSVKVIGVYPGGINTNFYKNSRDYVSEEKQATFMNPKDVAETILSNVMSDKNLTVADIIIERNS